MQFASDNLRTGFEQNKSSRALDKRNRVMPLPQRHTTLESGTSQDPAAAAGAARNVCQSLQNDSWIHQ